MLNFCYSRTKIRILVAETSPLLYNAYAFSIRLHEDVVVQVEYQESFYRTKAKWSRPVAVSPCNTSQRRLPSVIRASLFKFFKTLWP